MPTRSGLRLEPTLLRPLTHGDGDTMSRSATSRGVKYPFGDRFALGMDTSSVWLVTGSKTQGPIESRNDSCIIKFSGRINNGSGFDDIDTSFAVRASLIFAPGKRRQ